MFRKHKEYHKRSAFLPFVIFRLLLSLTIFATLLLGVYSAIKYFSGYDPFKLDPKALVATFLSTKEVEKLMNEVTSKVPQLAKVLPKDTGSLQKVLGTDQTNEAKTYENQPVASNSSPVVFSFVLVADSHNENNYLGKALQQSQNMSASASPDNGGAKPQFIIGLGDYTEVGSLSELQAAKKEFDSTGIRYFVTAGDHDLWQSRDQQNPPAENFIKVFGPPFQSFSYGHIRFLILHNSDNYEGLGEQQLSWLKDELERIKNEKDTKMVLAFMHEPLYHPSSDHTMGWVTKDLKPEAHDLIKTLKDGGVKEIFSGDIHYFSRYAEPESGMAMTTVGAVASARNTQAPRFARVTVHEDGSLDIEDIEIK